MNAPSFLLEHPVKVELALCNPDRFVRTTTTRLRRLMHLWHRQVRVIGLFSALMDVLDKDDVECGTGTIVTRGSPVTSPRFLRVRDTVL